MSNDAYTIERFLPGQREIMPGDIGVFRADMPLVCTVAAGENKHEVIWNAWTNANEAISELNLDDVPPYCIVRGDPKMNYEEFLAQPLFEGIWIDDYPGLCRYYTTADYRYHECGADGPITKLSHLYRFTDRSGRIMTKAWVLERVYDYEFNGKPIEGNDIRLKASK